MITLLWEKGMGTEQSVSFSWHLGLGDLLLLQGCLESFRIFSGILDLYPLDSSSTLLSAARLHNTYRHCQMLLGGKILPGWESLEERARIKGNEWKYINKRWALGGKVNKQIWTPKEGPKDIYTKGHLVSGGLSGTSIKPVGLFWHFSHYMP